MKLSNWKAKSLSLAGRITLAKATLSAIPLYTMQSSMLPISCCNKIKKLIRDFIWGSEPSSCNVSLVNWEIMTSPISHEGCGIPQLHTQNCALIAKLAMSLLYEPEKLWVQVVKTKYN